MQEVINKVKTYLGFSLKSGSIIFGYDNIVKRINKIKLIILCSSANEKTILNIKKLKQETIKLKRRFGQFSNAESLITDMESSLITSVLTNGFPSPKLLKQSEAIPCTFVLPTWSGMVNLPSFSSSVLSTNVQEVKIPFSSIHNRYPPWETS